MNSPAVSQVVADGASSWPDPGLWWTIGASKWIRRSVSGAVLQLPARSECRDLIGARSELTPHSRASVLRVVGQTTERDAERGMDMAMSASESPATVSEVVLGVDTHLEMHVVVALDGLGRRLGELAVSTTTEGYERLICWAQSFGTVGCAGVEGTGSYGVELADNRKILFWYYQLEQVQN
jgi:hypothetical protein